MGAGRAELTKVYWGRKKKTTDTFPQPGGQKYDLINSINSKEVGP